MFSVYYKWYIAKQKWPSICFFFHYHIRQCRTDLLWNDKRKKNSSFLFVVFKKNVLKKKKLFIYLCDVQFASWVWRQNYKTQAQYSTQSIVKHSGLLFQSGSLSLTCDLLEQRDVLHLLRQRGDLLPHGGVSGRSILQVLQGFNQLLRLFQNAQNDSVAVLNYYFNQVRHVRRLLKREKKIYLTQKKV